MLIKFFKNGQGGGSAPVDYLVANKVLAYDENRNLVRDEAGKPVLKERDPLPEVLAGDPERTKLLIDSSRNKWSYRAGVLSFDKSDAPSEAQQRTVMDRFETLAFAGLERDQYDVLWVRHTHENRVELHFCTPRLELTTGNSLNIAPPGYLKAMDALRDMLNKEHGWADPEDPSRARETKVATERKQRAQSREEIQDWISELVVAGRITTRPEMIETLQSAGFEIPRAGKTYLTVKDPETDTRWRLKGSLFHEGWTREATAQRTLESQHASRRTAPRRLDGISLDELRDRYQSHTQKRADYNRARFGRSASRNQDRDRSRAEPLEKAARPLSSGAQMVPAPVGSGRIIFTAVGAGRNLVLGNQLSGMANSQEPSKRAGRQPERIPAAQPDKRHPGPLHPQSNHHHVQRHEGVIHGTLKPPGARIVGLRATIDRRLSAFQRGAQRLGETLDRFAERTTGTAGNLSKRLNQLASSVQRGIARLADRSSQLQRALGHPQQRHELNRPDPEQDKRRLAMKPRTPTTGMER